MFSSSKHFKQGTQYHKNTIRFGGGGGGRIGKLGIDSFCGGGGGRASLHLYLDHYD